MFKFISNYMKRCFLLFLLFVGAFFQLKAEERFTDWDKTNWGTRNFEFRKLYPHIEAYKASREYVIAGETYSSSYVLRNSGIGESYVTYRSMDVYFLCDKTNALSAIQLEQTNWHEREDTFEYLKEFLSTKYSKPVSEKIIKDKVKPEIRRRSVYWQTKNSKITLLNLSIPDQGLYRVSITYQKL